MDYYSSIDGKNLKKKKRTRLFIDKYLKLSYKINLFEKK